MDLGWLSCAASRHCRPCGVCSLEFAAAERPVGPEHIQQQLRGAAPAKASPPSLHFLTQGSDSWSSLWIGEQRPRPLSGWEKLGWGESEAFTVMICAFLCVSEPVPHLCSSSCYLGILNLAIFLVPSPHVLPDLAGEPAAASHPGSSTH